MLYSIFPYCFPSSRTVHAKGKKCFSSGDFLKRPLFYPLVTRGHLALTTSFESDDVIVSAAGLHSHGDVEAVQLWRHHEDDLGTSLPATNKTRTLYSWMMIDRSFFWLTSRSRLLKFLNKNKFYWEISWKNGAASRQVWIGSESQSKRVSDLLRPTFAETCKNDMRSS